MVTTDNTQAPATLQATLRVQPVPSGRFEIRDGDRLLGTSQNEMMAVWSAVTVAIEMAKTGRKVRVVRLERGREIEEFAA